MDIQQQLMDRITATITKQPVDLPFEPTIEAFKQWEEDLPILNFTLND